MVERICGISREDFLEVAEHADRELGPRAHLGALLRPRLDAAHDRRADDPHGAILQLLLGNIGRPGGGIMALRGHASIQGSTDIPTLYDLLPGYLHMPAPATTELDARGLRRHGRRDRGWWSNFDKYIVSL